MLAKVYRPIAVFSAVLGFFSPNLGLATEVPLLADGQWQEFDVAADVAQAGRELDWVDNVLGQPGRRGDNSPLAFNFTIMPGEQGVLTVVDAGYSGDAYKIFNQQQLLGTTTLPAATVDINQYSGLYTTDFDAALADPQFSRQTFYLSAGDYSITGHLINSATVDGSPLNSSIGAVKLSVSAVPEASSFWLLLAGMGVLAALIKRRLTPPDQEQP